jgi:type I restriction enzyme R subunit
LVAFSGTVEDAGVPFTEAGMNGFPDTQTAQQFDTDAYRILVVAEKFQTGFDQPLLYAMYVDKPLSGLNAVQTLSRLNRIHPDKDGTFVLDFRNDAEEIRAAFEPYYGETVAPPSDPNLLYDTLYDLDEFGVLHADEVVKVVALLLAVSGPADHGRVHAALAPAIDRYHDLDGDEQDRFREALSRFVRTYGFLSQIVSFTDTDLERDYIYCRALSAFVKDSGGETVDLGSDIELTHLRQEKQFEGSVTIQSDTGEVVTIFSGVGRQNEPEPESLSTIIARFNERYGTAWTDADRLFPDAIEEDLVNDERIQLEAAGNDLRTFKVGFDQTYLAAIASRLDRNEKVAGRLLDDDELRNALVAEYLPRIYARARVARQRTCPIGDSSAPTGRTATSNTRPPCDGTSVLSPRRPASPRRPPSRPSRGSSTASSAEHC